MTTNLTRIAIIILILSSLTGCAFPGSTKPVVKLGIIAPFEGEQRADGYQRLYGVKLALQEVNRQGGLAGYKFELVALNDNADLAETILQARELVLDSEVWGVIGAWEPALFRAAQPVYQEANLAVINPATITDFSALPADFENNYQAFSGSLPDQQAKQAYLAVYRLLQAIKTVSQQNNTPDRSAVGNAMPLSGPF